MVSGRSAASLWATAWDIASMPAAAASTPHAARQARIAIRKSDLKANIGLSKLTRARPAGTSAAWPTARIPACPPSGQAQIRQPRP
ncbi:Uncharacterised protein [Bordetella pertussis]|nr:Uncharacterised protein [Bordetella pertussis]CFU02530.1 Uncharacterised protein [Bordetella pertussis]